MSKLAKYIVMAQSFAGLLMPHKSSRPLDENSTRAEIIRAFKGLESDVQKALMESPDSRIENEGAKDYLLRKKIKRVIGSSGVEW